MSESQNWESTSVAAVLARHSGEDVAGLLAELVELLLGVAPRAEVKRALLSRKITSVRLPLGSAVYQLVRRSDGGYDTNRQQEVRGVVIRTDPMEIDAFLAELGNAIDEEARKSDRAREALMKWTNQSS